MNTGVFKRVLAVLISGLLLCASVPAQLTFGDYGMRSVAAPTLQNRTRLSTGLVSGRPRLSFVGVVGGVAFDGTARPAADLRVNNLSLDYSSARRDGERLSVTINNQQLSASIYDWQMIPIANFVASDSYSCFTLFGDLQDAQLQAKVVADEGRILNYHPAFVDTLMGLRLFQLDSLIINEYSWDLIRENKVPLLGAGELTPNTDANKRGLLAFADLLDKSPEFDSYVISDNRRNILFNVAENKLNIDGEPSYYFWSFDKELLTDKKIDEATERVATQLLEEARRAEARGELTSEEEWVRKLLVAEVRSYEELIGNLQILRALNFPELTRLVSIPSDNGRRALVRTQSLETLIEQLVLVRTLKQIQHAVEIRELSDTVSGRTAMLRAINPVVWESGVTLLRYAAFFRYCKQYYPQQWQSFMAQIGRAPAPRPYVTTPTILEGRGKGK